MVAGANIPLVVLSRGLWFKTTPPSPDAQGEARLGIWQELHRELATRSPRAELVVAKHTGHYIQKPSSAAGPAAGVLRYARLRSFVSLCDTVSSVSGG